MRKKPLQLYGITEFAKELGGNWTVQKLWVYYDRGKLPNPNAFVGERPAWSKEQIEEFKNQQDEKKPSDEK